MKYWYFLFEGEFKKIALKHSSKGVMSSVMLPAENKDKAMNALATALDKNDIKIINVEDNFQFDIDDIDETDDENIVWVNWFEEVLKCQEAVFTPWQVFDIKKEYD